MATSYLLRNKNLLKGVKPFKERRQDEETCAIQQSDYLRNFMLKIQDDGLNEAYSIYGDSPPRPSAPTRAPIGVEYDVIVVGAGMAGLAAAYELKSAGLSVKILEQTDRYGGRVFTYGEADGLADGLYGEAGAMRLPGAVDETTERAHFLTDGYITKFGLRIKKFPNFDKNGFSNIYGFREKTEDWAKKYFDTIWPEWKKGINGDMKQAIKNIDKYYELTTAVVTDQLIALLENTNNIEEEIVVWDRWIDIWSQFTLESFLESNIEVILAKVPEADRQYLDVETLGNLLPWSNDAVRGYSVSSYTEQLDQSLVQYLRDQLGKWWSHNMHTLVGGMHSLPDAFFTFGENKLNLPDDVEFNKKVSKISYLSLPNEPSNDFVSVTCYAYESEPEPTYRARAVIVTTQVNILRQITFKPLVNDETNRKALRKNLQAIEDMYTGPATKIILQTKRRFWEDHNIHGGFSKTNLPIGQIHYVEPDEEYRETTKQGIILIYTWKNEALLFGSLTKDQARQEAIEQVAEIHKEINEEGAVENCIVHAWYNQPSYQGAYGLLKTTQFNNIRYLWDPMGNVHFAGDNISFAPGWIQGALESGFKSAYQVYARHMHRERGK